MNYFRSAHELTHYLAKGSKADRSDLAEQAIPGHGIPSQDLDPAAQFGLSPKEAEREPKSILIGSGLVAGMAAGAAVGAAVADPVRILLGTSVGAVAGVVGTSAVGELVNTKTDDNGPDDLEDVKRGNAPS